MSTAEIPKVTDYRTDPRNQLPGNIGDTSQPLPGGPWLRLEGMVGSDQDGKYSAYWENPPVLVIISTAPEDLPSGKAAVFIAPNTKLNRDTLKKQGFTRERGEDIVGLTSALPNNISMYTDLMADASLPLVPGNANNERDPAKHIILNRDLFPVSGYHYRELHDKEIRRLPEVIGDPRFLGTYNVSKTGVLTVVNMNGEQFIGRADLVPKLEALKYRHARTLDVPFALMETPVNYLGEVGKSATAEFVESIKKPALTNVRLADLRRLMRELVFSTTHSVVDSVNTLPFASAMA